jgi:hypothetical protein
MPLSGRAQTSSPFQREGSGVIDNRMSVDDAEPLFLDEPDDLPTSTRVEPEGMEALFDDENALRVSEKVNRSESISPTAGLIVLLLAGALLGFVAARALLN